ncbi:MAG: hypothetical protein J1F02_02450, partial [Lachnospiraceae bacterium]|nr:hypothetical protein [Lachnospiraceae bacterium]
MGKSDCKKHKLLRRGVKKRMMALFMTAVMLFGCAYNAAPPAEAFQVEKSLREPVVGLGLRKKIKSAAIGSLTAFGNKVVGSLITGIAGEIDEATGGTGASKIANWINTWVLGNNSLVGKLMQVEELCQDILDEVHEVEAKIDDTSSTVEEMLARQNQSGAYDRMNDEWERAAVPQTEDVNNALAAFRDYLSAARDYKDNPGSTSKENAYEKAQKTYRDKLIDIYKGHGDDKEMADEDEVLKGAMTSYTIGSAIKNDLAYMIDRLGGTDEDRMNYMDYTAQAAYMSMMFAGDQYEYISAQVKNQLLQICLMEFMYMDYLSWQGEYLMENCKNDENYDRYMLIYKALLEEFNGLYNEEFLEEAGALMTRPIHFNPDNPRATTHLYTYMQPRNEHSSDEQSGDELPMPVYSDEDVRRTFYQRGILNEDGTVTAVWFMTDEEGFQAKDLPNDYSKHYNWNDSVTDEASGKSTQNDWLQAGTRADGVLSKMLSSNAFRAAGSQFSSVLAPELLGKVKDQSKKYIVIGQSGSDYVIVDMDAQMAEGELVTETWSHKQVTDSDKNLYYQLVLGPAEGKKYHVWLEAADNVGDKNECTVRDASGNSGTCIATTAETGIFTLEFPRNKKDADGNPLVPVAIKAACYENAPGDSENNSYDHESAMKRENRVKNEATEYTMFGYNELQNIMDDDSSSDTVSIPNIPIPYTADMRMEVVYEKPVYADGDKPMTLELDSEKNQLKVSFHTDINAKEAEITVAREENFQDVMYHEVKDVKEKTDDEITLDIDPKEVGLHTLYVKVQSLDERDYGVVYGPEQVGTVEPEPVPEITAKQVSLGTVEVAVSGEMQDTTGVVVEACAKPDFPDGEIRTQSILNKDGTDVFQGGTVTFSNLATAGTWYFRTSYLDQKGNTVRWCTSEEVNIFSPADGIESIQVISPSAVKVTADRVDSESEIGGYIFRAGTYYKDTSSEDATDAVMERQDAEVEVLPGTTESAEDRTYTFTDLSPVEWNFTVQTYRELENGETYSPIVDIQTISLAPEGSDDDLILSRTGQGQIKVDWNVSDYSTTCWDIYVNGELKCSKVSGEQVITGLIPGNIDVEVRNFAKEPNTDKYVQGNGGKKSINLMPQAAIASVGMAAKGTVRTELETGDSDTFYTYTLYDEEHNQVATEDTNASVCEFREVPEGFCTVEVTPYYKTAGGNNIIGETVTSDMFGTGAPRLEHVYLDPFLTDKDSGSTSPLLISVQSGENVKAVEMELSTDDKFTEPEQVQNNSQLGVVMVKPGDTVYLRMRSVWSAPEGGEDFSSDWSDTVTIDLSKTQKYYNILNQLMDEGNLEFLWDETGEKLSIRIPEELTAEDGSKADYAGLRVRLTRTSQPGNTIVDEYAEGNEIVISGLDKSQTYYAWVTLYGYGDKEKKILLNGKYVGPVDVKKQTTDPGKDDPGTDSDKKDPGATATPVPTTKPTQPPAQTPTPTPKDTTGLEKGEKATAGSGSTKAVYKATGKSTVTYLKTKVKKSAKKATVPATIKIKGKKYKVTKIAKGAFKGHKKLKTVIVKAKGLT